MEKKHSILLTLVLLTNSVLFGQQNSINDYNIYSSLIKAEVVTETRSVTIIKKLRRRMEEVLYKVPRVRWTI